MIDKLVIASLLAGSSVAASGQQAARTAGASASSRPHMHQCTLSPVGSSFAINTKGTGAQSGRAAGGATTGWSRIDIHWTGSNSGEAITAFAINTKGTGTSSGRASSDMAINTKGHGGAAGRASGEVATETEGAGVPHPTYSGATHTLKGIARTGQMRNQLPIGLDCVKSVVTGDEAAQKASLASFAFMSADGKGLGWSCSVSGSEEKPQFVVGLLVPTILGQAERSAAPGAAARSEWSWGVSQGGHRVSIVPRTAQSDDSWHVACASKEPRQMNYDLVMNKKL